MIRHIEGHKKSWPKEEANQLREEFLKLEVERKWHTDFIEALIHKTVLEKFKGHSGLSSIEEKRIVQGHCCDIKNIHWIQCNNLFVSIMKKRKLDTYSACTE
jgi:hypothetical protein